MNRSVSRAAPATPDHVTEHLNGVRFDGVPMFIDEMRNKENLLIINEASVNTGECLPRDKSTSF